MRGSETYLIQDNQDILEAFASLYKEADDGAARAKRISTAVLSNTAWWSQDLTQIEGLQHKVEKNLEAIWQSACKKKPFRHCRSTHGAEKIRYNPPR